MSETSGTEPGNNRGDEAIVHPPQTRLQSEPPSWRVSRIIAYITAIVFGTIGLCVVVIIAIFVYMAVSMPVSPTMEEIIYPPPAEDIVAGVQPMMDSIVQQLGQVPGVTVQQLTPERAPRCGANNAGVKYRSAVYSIGPMDWAEAKKVVQMTVTAPSWEWRGCSRDQGYDIPSCYAFWHGGSGMLPYIWVAPITESSTFNPHAGPVNVSVGYSIDTCHQTNRTDWPS